MWRRAWGWVGPADRRSRIRRTSRGVSGSPRRLTNTTSSGVSASTSSARPWSSHWREGRRPPVAERGTCRCLDALAPDASRGDRRGRCRPGGGRRALGDPQAAAVEQLEHGVVRWARAASTGSSVGPAGRRRGATSSSSGAEHPGQAAVVARGRQLGPRGRPRCAPVAAASRSSGAASATLAGDRAAGVAPGGEVGEVAAQAPGGRRRSGPSRPRRPAHSTKASRSRR